MPWPLYAPCAHFSKPPFLSSSWTQNKYIAPNTISCKCCFILLNYYTLWLDILLLLFFTLFPMLIDFRFVEMYFFCCWIASSFVNRCQTQLSELTFSLGFWSSSLEKGSNCNYGIQLGKKDFGKKFSHLHFFENILFHCIIIIIAVILFLISMFSTFHAR